MRPRLLILGGSGWFGRTLHSVMVDQAEILSTSSRKASPYVTWDLASIRDFQPTVVANFAFLTPNRLREVGEDRFIHVNRELTSQFLRTLEVPTVRAAFTVSSGASTQSSEDPYGRLKLEEEQAALALSSGSLPIVIARTFSVSGPYVREPARYAFSNMVMQAQAGRVWVAADRPTYRRYTSVRDVLQVSMNLVADGYSGVVETGGELIEMGDLAMRILAQVNPSGYVERAPQVSEVPSIYASDNVSWTWAVSRSQVTAASLSEQIDAVSAWMTCG